MQKILLTFLFIGISTCVALSHVPEKSQLETDEKVAQEMVELISPQAAIIPAILKVSIKPELECSIVPVTVSCGGTYETQYCDGGLHGNNVGEWALQVEEWACG